MMRNPTFAAILITIVATCEIAAQQPNPQDKVLRTTEESKYLETGGGPKLGVVYKSVEGREVKLVLY